MAGLLEKDFRLLLHRKQLFALFVVIALLMGFTMDSSFVIGYLTFIVAVWATSTLSYDEYDNGYPFLMTLPIDPKLYAAEKYVFCIGGSLLSWILVMIFCLLVTAVRGSSSSLPEQLLLGTSMIPCCVLLLAVVLPLQLKFGAEKSRIVLCILCGAVGGLVLGTIQAMSRAGADTASLLHLFQRIPGPLLAVLCVLLLAAVLAVSFLVSIKIMVRKEY